MKKALRALNFAHLVSFGSKSKAEVDDEDTDGRDKNDDGEQDHEDGDAKKKSKAKKAEEEKDDERAEDDGSDEEASEDHPDDDEDNKKSKKAKAEEKDDEDDDDVEMRGNSPIARARRREQARCAAIFASRAAGKNPVLAANLAFKTRMSRSEALAVLESTPAGRGNEGRAARNPNVGSGGALGLTSKQAVANRLDAAFARVNRRK